MNEAPKNISSALIDNWSLELSSYLLDDEYVERQKFAYSVDFLGDPRAIAQERISALFQLLDLIVTTDELIFDKTWAFGWESTNLLKPISPILSELKFNRLQDINISETPDDLQLLETPDKAVQNVRIGALYYFKLAKTLGVYYWPSPQRAEFLSEYKFSEPEGGFVRVLKHYVDSNLQEMIREIYTELNLNEPFLDFPGFGVAILGNCDSRQSILPTAMEFRETKECKSFREWLQKMDSALLIGNIKAISQSLKELKEITRAIRVELHLEDAPNEKTELQIGISPTLTVDSRLISSIINPLKPKKYHIIFLRNHFMRVLNGNVWSNSVRLFPEFSSK